MRFLRLASRNVQRNRRRTLLTLSAIALSVAALVLVWAIFDGQNAQMTENMTGYSTGHVQIHRRGYDKNPSLELAFRPAEVAAAQRQPGVTATAARLSGFALLGSNTNARGVLVVGVDPQAEMRVTTLHTKIAMGRYFGDGDRGGVVLGKPLAKSMGLAVGSEVALITEGIQASIGAQLFRVYGIYDTGNDMLDSQQVFVVLGDARTLFNSDGEVTTVAIRTASLEAVDGAIAALRSAAGSSFEVLGWRELLPDVAQHVDFHESMAAVAMLLLFVIVAAGVANTLLMAVVEREREFGVMMALGTSPWQICRGILYEGLLIGSIGFAIGLAIGGGLAVWLGAAGIERSDLAQSAQAFQGLTNRAYPLFKWERAGLIGAGLLAIVAVATAYPAWRAARLSPVAAMRGLRGKGKRFRGRLHSSRCIIAVLAARNLVRFPLRSSLALTVVSLGLGAFVFIAAFLDGYLGQIEDSATSLVTGNLQIQHADFRAEAKPSLAFAATPDWLSKLRDLPPVQAVSPRVQAAAMLGSAVRAEPIIVLGVEPVHENRVTILHRTIRDGQDLQRGRDILVGRELAERLDVRLGEKVVMVLQDLAGNLASEAFTVTGIFSTGDNGLDRSRAYVMLSKLQNMAGLGARVTNVAIRLHRRDQMAPALLALSALVPAGDLRVLRWEELLPAIVEISNTVSHGLVLITAVVFLLVALVVTNATLMSVLERSREFGTLLAIGASPLAVVRLVAWESAILAVAGVALGMMSGGGVAYGYSQTGLQLQTVESSAVPGVTDVVYPAISAAHLAGPSLGLFVLVMLASIYPALKISRLDAVEAMRRT